MISVTKMVHGSIMDKVHVVIKIPNRNVAFARLLRDASLHGNNFLVPLQ